MPCLGQNPCGAPSTVRQAKAAGSSAVNGVEELPVEGASTGAAGVTNPRSRPTGWFRGVNVHITGKYYASPIGRVLERFCAVPGARWRGRPRPIGPLRRRRSGGLDRGCHGGRTGTVAGGHRRGAPNGPTGTARGWRVSVLLGHQMSTQMCGRVVCLVQAQGTQSRRIGDGPGYHMVQNICCTVQTCPFRCFGPFERAFGF